MRASCHKKNYPIFLLHTYSTKLVDYNFRNILIKSFEKLFSSGSIRDFAVSSIWSIISVTQASNKINCLIDTKSARSIPREYFKGIQSIDTLIKTDVLKIKNVLLYEFRFVNWFSIRAKMFIGKNREWFVRRSGFGLRRVDLRGTLCSYRNADI